MTTRTYDETAVTRDGIVIGDTVLTPDEIEVMSTKPESIGDLDTARAIIHFVEREVASIDAQIEARILVMKALGESTPDDLSWCRRAAFARTMRQNKLKKLEHFWGVPNGSASPPVVPPAPTGNSPPSAFAIASANALANLEATRIAAASRKLMAERLSQRELLFIELCQTMLSKEQVQAIWARVDSQIPKK